MSTEIKDLEYYEDKLDYYEKHERLSVDEINEVRKILKQMGPSENFKKYWEENVHVKVSKLSTLRKNVIANLKSEINKTLSKYPKSIEDFEERVFKNGEFKKEICDPRIYKSDFKDQKIGLEETAKKIRKLLRKEKTELDNLDYYLNKISEYEKDGNITSDESKEIRSVLEKMGPSKNFENFWRKKVSQKIGKLDIEKGSDAKKKVFSEIEHTIKPILDKLELQSKQKNIKLKSRSGFLIVGKNVFSDYEKLKEPYENIHISFKVKEIKHKERIISDMNMIYNIAKNILTDEDSNQLKKELEISCKSILGSYNELNIKFNELKLLWVKDKSNKDEQELNKEMFSKILIKPRMLRDNKILKERKCAAFKSAQILSNFYTEIAKIKSQQRIIICKFVDRIKKLIGIDDNLSNKKWKSGEINKDNARKMIIGNNRKK